MILGCNINAIMLCMGAISIILSNNKSNIQSDRYLPKKITESQKIHYLTNHFIASIKINEK